MMCCGLQDETAARKKTDVPSAASVDAIDRTNDVSSAVDKGIKIPSSSSSARNAGISQRKGRGKSMLNAVDDDIVSTFLC